MAAGALGSGGSTCLVGSVAASVVDDPSAPGGQWDRDNMTNLFTPFTSFVANVATGNIMNVSGLGFAPLQACMPGVPAAISSGVTLYRYFESTTPYTAGYPCGQPHEGTRYWP